jgi:hypothetical protein
LCQRTPVQLIKLQIKDSMKEELITTLNHFRVALLGEIYPAIRVIAVKLDDEKNLTMRWYLDREPNDDDRENMEIVAVNFGWGPPEMNFKKLDLECVWGKGFKRDLDVLDGAIYSRKES